MDINEKKGWQLNRKLKQMQKKTIKQKFGFINNKYIVYWIGNKEKIISFLIITKFSWWTSLHNDHNHDDDDSISDKQDLFCVILWLSFGIQYEKEKPTHLWSKTTLGFD